MDPDISELIKQFNAPPAKTEYVFGCRHPKSDGIWNDAFIVAKSVDSSTITAAMFQNGMDFIGHPEDFSVALKQYEQLISENWIPMDTNDVKKTSGVSIDVGTITDPYDAWLVNGTKSRRIYNKFVYIFALFCILVVLCSDLRIFSTPLTKYLLGF